VAIPVFNPRRLAERGEEIYRRKFKADFESRHKGEFVAIDVDGERAFSGNTPDDAYAEARRVIPEGVFHLIKVGEPGAYRISYGADGDSDWLFK
jgi:hypothetical protein